jgi:thiamine-monophosphate kinase
MPHEFDLIKWIRSSAASELPPNALGIGDDCAVWPVGDRLLLLATDMLVEDVHFTLSELQKRQIGRKAVAVNLSDIAAMAGVPQTIMVSLALPLHIPLPWAEELMAGVIEAAQEFDTHIIGGDTTVHQGPLVINVAITGEATAKGPVLRSGAQPGDAIFVTGPLGGSLSDHHWSFTPRVREALQLHQIVDLHAMIDLSDGLSSDLRHVLNASAVGCELLSEKIPVSDASRQRNTGRTPLDHALGDGEDFELLFTVSREDAGKLRRQTPIPLFEIGTIVKDPQTIVLKEADGRIRDLPDTGWKHALG